MKKTLLSSMLVAGLITSTAVMAGDHKRGDEFGKGHGSKIYRKLGLTDVQKQQVRRIMQAAKGSKLGKHQYMLEKMKARQALIQAPTLDEAALNRLANDTADSVKKRFIARTKAEHQIWQLLTPKQREKAEKMQERRAKKMQKRMEKREKRMKKQSDNNS